TDRTLTSPAGTFLTKRLTSTARNFRASFCRVGPLACSSKLRVDNLVHQSNVGFDIKEFSWQIHRYFFDSHVVRLPSLHREPTQRGHGDRYCTFNEQQVVLCIDAVQSEVLGGSFDIAHTAGQFFTFENAAWRGGATNRTWFTVVLLLTVRSACATEI